MVETRLRWFQHVERRPLDFVVRSVNWMEGSQITRDKGRPRKTISETIKKDLETRNLDSLRILGWPNSTLQNQLVR
jgi:hypothetical protein